MSARFRSVKKSDALITKAEVEAFVSNVAQDLAEELMKSFANTLTQYHSQLEGAGCFVPEGLTTLKERAKLYAEELAAKTPVPESLIHPPEPPGPALVH